MDNGHNPLFDQILNMPQMPEEKSIEEQIAHLEQHVELADRLMARYQVMMELLQENLLEEHTYMYADLDHRTLRILAGRQASTQAYKDGTLKAIAKLRADQSQAISLRSAQGSSRS